MTRLEPDPWLTGFAGVAAHRVVLDGGVDEIAGELRATLGSPSFVSAKVPADDVSSVGRLEELGFRVVDVNVTLNRPVNTAAVAPPNMRFATPADEDAVADLAGTLMRSRFHLDPAFPPGAADALKEDWARNFWRGARGKWMVVAELDGNIGGFLQLLHHDDRLVVDLIAVAPAVRRRGVARSMMTFADASCGPVREVVVGTQVGNVSSLRLYESAGFRVAATAYVLHAHGPR